MEAPLSYTSQYGYYGLRVNPTFDQAVGTIRKPFRIPLPDRMAKWYALSPYRALILDAEAKYQDYEAASIAYKQSGAHLPEAAARVRPSDAAYDDTFDELDRQGEAQAHQHAYETAFELMNEEHRRETADLRSQQLGAIYGADTMNPVIAANHDDLEEAGVSHFMPAARLPPVNRGYSHPPQQFAAAGRPQFPELPAFQTLNMGQPATLRQGNLSRAENMTYERVRDLAVPTQRS
jgi:hypothetical protein